MALAATIVTAIAVALIVPKKYVAHRDACWWTRATSRP